MRPLRFLLLAAAIALLLHGSAEANRPAGSRTATSRQTQRVPEPARLRATGKAARPNLRVRAKSLRGGEQAARLSKRRIDRHPAVRKAVQRYLGDEGRDIRRNDVSARAIFENGRITGYRVRVKTLAFDGSKGVVTLHIDAEGNLNSVDGADPDAQRDGVIRAKRVAKTARIKRAAKRVPLAKRFVKKRADRIAHRKRLVEEYRKKNNIEQQVRDQAADRHIGEVYRHSERDNSTIYTVSDLHTSTGEGNKTEDFRADDAMVAWLNSLNTDGKEAATVACAGDCLEFMENIAHDRSPGEVLEIGEQLLRGHPKVYRAVVDAVMNRGVRFVFTGGNHDVQMLMVYDQMIRKMGEVGGLKSKQDLDTFRQRVAYAGTMAVFGKHGEYVVFHGHQHDPTNNWRSNSNPFRYVVNRKGEVSRQLESNMGYTIVQHFWKYMEKATPKADNEGKSSASSATKGLIQRPRNILRLARVLWKITGENTSLNDATIEATLKDDRIADLSHAERSRLAERWNLSGPEEVVDYIDRLQAQMPQTVDSYMTSNRLVNFGRMLFGTARNIMRQRKHSESDFAGLVTSILPNVIAADGGHTHRQGILRGFVDGRGNVVYRNTGTWTEKGGVETRTVTVTKMKGGRLADEGLQRYEFDAQTKTGSLVRQDEVAPPDVDRPIEWAAPQ